MEPTAAVVQQLKRTGKQRRGRRDERNKSRVLIPHTTQSPKRARSDQGRRNDSVQLHQQDESGHFGQQAVMRAARDSKQQHGHCEQATEGEATESDDRRTYRLQTRNPIPELRAQFVNTLYVHPPDTQIDAIIASAFVSNK